MIDTIFYFVEHESDYLAQRENISPKTIVFVQDTHEIYLNGWAYGKTSTEGLATTDDYNNVVDALNISREEINLINQQLATLRTNIEREIEESVEQAFTDEESIRNNAVLNGQIDQKIGEWESLAHLVTTDSTTWTNLTQSVSSISARATQIDHNFDGTGNIKQSVFESGVTGTQAYTNMASRWAVADANQKVIKWLASGFASQADNNTTFADVYSAAQNNTSDAISNIHTEILNLDNTYVAKASLVTEVQNKALQIRTAAGVYSKSLVDNAIAGIWSENVSGTNKTLSQLLTQANTDSATLAGLVTWKNTTNTTIAGLQTTAGLDHAMAQLIASTSSESGKGASGAIGVAIQNGISTATILADHINLKGAKVTVGNTDTVSIDATTGTLTAVNGTFSGTITSTSGTIGGFSIGSTNIHNGVTSLSDTSHDGVYIGTNGIVLGKGKFKVTSAGVLTATGGTFSGSITSTSGSIGGFTIDSTNIHNGVTSISDTAHNGVYVGTDGIVLGKGKFKVTSSGVLTAVDGNFSGTIETTSGTIGGFSIGSTNIHNGVTSLSDTSHNGVYVGTDGIVLGKGKFKVTSSGVLTAIGGTFNGTIETTTGNTVTNTINSDGSGSLGNGGISWDTSGVFTLSSEVAKSLYSTLNNGLQLSDSEDLQYPYRRTRMYIDSVEYSKNSNTSGVTTKITCDGISVRKWHNGNDLTVITDNKIQIKPDGISMIVQDQAFGGGTTATSYDGVSDNVTVDGTTFVIRNGIIVGVN